jgi:hypothetical protein
MTPMNTIDVLPLIGQATDDAPTTPVPRASARLLIIGGGGDLGTRKLMPALRRLPAGIADCLENAKPPSRS